MSKRGREQSEQQKHEVQGGRFIPRHRLARPHAWKPKYKPAELMDQHDDQHADPDYLPQQQQQVAEQVAQQQVAEAHRLTTSIANVLAQQQQQPPARRARSISESGNVRLPPELVHEILKHLSFKDVRSYAETSKTAHNEATSTLRARDNENRKVIAITSTEQLKRELTMAARMHVSPNFRFNQQTSTAAIIQMPSLLKEVAKENPNAKQLALSDISIYIELVDFRQTDPSVIANYRQVDIFLCQFPSKMDFSNIQRLTLREGCTIEGNVWDLSHCVGIVQLIAIVRGVSLKPPKSCQTFITVHTNLLQVDLENCTQLEVVKITHSTELQEIKGLSQCTKLRECELIGLPALTGNIDLRPCTKLNKLTLKEFPNSVNIQR